jgi:hypothetical protein
MPASSLTTVLAGLLFLAACADTGPPAPRAPTDVPIELVLPTIQGPAVDLASLRGNVVLIDVMATWSVASQSEVRTFQHLLVSYRERGLRIVSIAMDSQTPQLVSTWVETLGIIWPMALATPEVIEGRSSLGRIPEIPRTMILDRRGFVRFDRSGMIPPGELAKTLEGLLGLPGGFTGRSEGSQWTQRLLRLPLRELAACICASFCCTRLASTCSGSSDSASRASFAAASFLPALSATSAWPASARASS